MKNPVRFFLVIAFVLCHSLAMAKVDLVILPKRDTVQLTIYNSADLTLVRESRALTLKQGTNRLQFSWANTLIDPTSLDMLPKMFAHQIDIVDLVYPPRVQNLGLWDIKSQLSGNVPVEITYLTSGLSWRAFYMGTMQKDEKQMRLQGYVMVTNNSGEEYESAEVRLIVGKINVIDQIADLARREYPYGRPGPVPVPSVRYEEEEKGARWLAKAKDEIMQAADVMEARPKEIKKEGLSEYFLYTIEGEETIPNGWSKRLPSIEVDEIPVVNLYKYEEERYGDQVVRYLSFKNDERHKLGETPIPGGDIKVYRIVDEAGHLSYEGQSSFKYIPVDEDVELNLGPVTNVMVKTVLMDFKTGSYLFNNEGNISGWDEIHTYEIEANNTRDIEVKVEIKRNFATSSWEITQTGDYGEYKKIDLDTMQYTVELNAHAKKAFRYVLTTHHGERAD